MPSGWSEPAWKVRHPRRGDVRAAVSPTKAERVLRLIREARGGKLYDSEWGQRMRGRGEYAELLRKRFEHACRRFGLRTRDGRGVDLDVTRFRVPGRPEQGSLFG